jgi:Mg-chelatase subunit ChlD
VAKNSVNLVIDGLTGVDWVGVVTFGSESSAYNNLLVQATAVNKEAIKQYVENLETDGATNFGAGFSQAFEIL